MFAATGDVHSAGSVKILSLSWGIFYYRYFRETKESLSDKLILYFVYNTLMNNVFCYHPEVLSTFPNLHAAIVLAEGLQNSSTSAPLCEIFLHEQQAVLKTIGQTPLSEIDSLAGWRVAFRKFGVDPTQYRSSAEALLRRLTKKGDIPCINSLVDMANLVSIRYALPVAAFDLRALKLPITVRFASGSERYTPLGEPVIENPIPGEVIFTDETDLVIARRWCHRQSDESAARQDTNHVLFTIEAQHEGGETSVRLAMADLLDLVKCYAEGECQIALLP
jgi:DNA/RNA-binding domain of Phe-tRNA-synthetase-like protein